MSNKFDQSFHSKIGQGMDMDLPSKYDNDDITSKVMMNGMGGYVNGGYIFNEEDEDRESSYSVDDPQHEEVYYYPVEDVIVEDCCPAVIYRVMPCCYGDDNSPFWESWNRHRLLGSRSVNDLIGL